MNNKLKSELKVGDIYTFRIKRKQVKQIKKTYFPDGVWDNIKEFMIEYTHRTLMYSIIYKEKNYDTIKHTPMYVDVSWNYENTKIDNIMMNDYTFNPCERNNFMWIKIIKEKYHWKKGERLYIDMKCNCDGLFTLWGVKKREHKTHQMYINSKGFVVHLKTYFNKYNKTKDTNDLEYKYILADCMYNDLLKISS